MSRETVHEERRVRVRTILCKLCEEVQHLALQQLRLRHGGSELAQLLRGGAAHHGRLVASQTGELGAKLDAHG